MDALQRGDVVLRARVYGVVWAAGPDGVALHRLHKPGRLRAGDVALSLGELIAAGIEMGEAVVRMGQPVLAGPGELRRVGALSGPVCCRLTLAAIRAADAARVESVWALERRHRAAVRGERPVKLVG